MSFRAARSAIVESLSWIGADGLFVPRLGNLGWSVTFLGQLRGHKGRSWAMDGTKHCKSLVRTSQNSGTWVFSAIPISKMLSRKRPIIIWIYRRWVTRSKPTKAPRNAFASQRTANACTVKVAPVTWHVVNPKSNAATYVVPPRSRLAWNELSTQP